MDATAGREAQKQKQKQTPNAIRLFGSHAKNNADDMPPRPHSNKSECRPKNAHRTLTFQVDFNYIHGGRAWLIRLNNSAPSDLLM